MKLELIAGQLSICRLPAASTSPPLADAGFLSLTRTADELSIVCAAGSEPAGATCDSGWSALRVAGVLDFSLTGVLASLAAPLAEAKVSIFAVSTFDTDYILVKHDQLAVAIEALRSAGHSLEE